MGAEQSAHLSDLAQKARGKLNGKFIIRQLLDLIWLKKVAKFLELVLNLVGL